MTPAERAAAALAALCWRAGVAPADGSEGAGGAVRAAVLRELGPDPGDVLHCPVSEWFARRGAPRVWVTATDAVVPVAPADRAPGGPVAALVPLPPAVLAAVRLIDTGARGFARKRRAKPKAEGDAA